MARRRRQEVPFTRFVRKYWGYLFLAAAIAGWQEHAFKLAVIAVLCALSLVYFLAASPMWCMAETRDGSGCRNNSHGILGGCTQVRQHKFQRLRDFFLPDRWRKTLGSLVASPATTLGTIGAIASIVPVVAVLVAHR